MCMLVLLDWDCSFKGLVCKKNFTSEGIESKIVQTMLKYKNLVLWAVDYVDMWWRYVATSSQVI